MTTCGERTFVMAVGSSHSDDRAAWAVADRLKSLLHGDIPIRKVSVPLKMLDWLESVCRVHIIDACEGGGEVGELLRMDWPADALTKLRAAGTHDFDVPSVLALAQQLNRLPKLVTIWAIVGRNFAPHQKLSTEVETRLQSIAQTIAKEANDARTITGAVSAETD